MPQCLDQCPNQRGFARAEVAFEVNHQPTGHCGRERLACPLRGSLVGQGKKGGNIGGMHDLNSGFEEEALKAAIRTAGRALGFSDIGFARAVVGDAADGLRAWLDAGFHGEMDYMARHAALRADPAALHAGTVTVISAALDYLPPLSATDAADAAIISRYALGRDYHKVVRSRLQKLADFIGQQIAPFGYRVFSDSAPVMEVHFAAQAGLGWQGKHTLLLSRNGSWRFLGEIFCDLHLTPDTPAENHCGRCTACIDACPTQAIVAPYRVDARRCISYLTIELAGAIPADLRPLIGNRIYGCDDCQTCCPWNRFARLGDPEFLPRHGLDSACLSELFAWSEATFNERLAGSPIRRIGHERWLRNIAVALGNAPPSAVNRAALQSRADHPSALVREHVAWALAASADKPVA